MSSRHEGVSIPGKPLPTGHYSPAFVSGNLVFVSGQLPWGIDGDETDVPVYGQAMACLQKMGAILAACGCSPDRVVKATVYLSDIEGWGEVNRAFADFFGDHRPARAVVPCGPLHFGCAVEIECMATVPN